MLLLSVAKQARSRFWGLTLLIFLLYIFAQPVLHGSRLGDLSTFHRMHAQIQPLMHDFLSLQAKAGSYLSCKLAFLTDMRDNASFVETGCMC